MISLDKITITPEEASSLREIDKMRAANAAIVEQFRASVERRNADIMDKGTALWSSLAKKYSLDVKHVQYGLSEEGDALTILAAQFPQ